jgi:RND family efflux transporter MFP subunit
MRIRAPKVAPRLVRAGRWILALVSVASFVVFLQPDLIGLRSVEEAAEPAPSAPRDRAWSEEDTLRVDESPAEAESASPEDTLVAEPLFVEEELPLPESEVEEPETAVLVEAGANESGETLDCVIEPYEVVEIGSPVTGVIEKVLVERSDLVEAGQVVAELESGVEKAAVEVARARAEMQGEIRAREASMALGESRKQRAKKLFDNSSLSLDLREQVDTEAKLARLELMQAKESRMLASLELKQALRALKRRSISSPISGVVVDRLMAPGEVVDEETIMRIAQIDPLRVEAILPSAMFGTVKPGMKAAVEPEFPGGQVYVATVKIVDRLIDAASGTFGVRLELPNADQSIPGGLHCQVRFLDEEE